MKYTKITEGDVFGNITVIKILDEMHEEPSGHRRRLVMVKCICKKEFKIPLAYLSRNGQKCSDCAFNTDSIVSIGKIYDKLLVISFTKSKNNRKLAVCRCICGNIVERRAELLATINMTNNCGCLPRGNWCGFGKISGTFFRRMKRNAKIRNIEFNLTIESLWELYEKQNGRCALTGIEIPFGKKTSNTNEASLDRIDSLKPYTKDNVQWVHKDVNLMKMDLPQNKFIELCKLIASKN